MSIFGIERSVMPILQALLICDRRAKTLLTPTTLHVVTYYTAKPPHNCVPPPSPCSAQRIF